MIADLRREGRSLRSIAAGLGRDVSTISREVRRNAHPTSGDYRPHAARSRADARRPRPKPGRIGSNPELRTLVQDMLDERSSPEQISRRLRRDHPDRPELHVTHETIYQALYVQGAGFAANSPGRCAPDAPCANPAATPTSAVPVSPRRWS